MTLAIVFIISAVIAAADQIIKYFVLRNLAPVGTVTLVDNLLSLVYVENRGAAFGMFQNSTVIFTVITFVMMGIFIYLIISKKFEGKLFLTATTLIIGGGIGNLIDRLFRGFVVDYFAVSFFPPVCNLADYCITIGAALFVISMLFSNKKEQTLAGTAEEKQ